MSKHCHLIFTSVLLVGTAVLATSVAAYDLSGVWASDIDRCGKIFTKTGKNVSFADMADLYGSGFIADGNELRGKTARCTVKTRRETQDALHILASCSTDIMLSNVQFSLRFINDHTVTRFFPEIPGMDLTYYRCTAM